MKPILAALALLAAAPLAHAEASAPPAPFHAEYVALRNGNALGRTSLDLLDNGDGTWTLRSETRGTSGLAKLAGVHVVETSTFRWRDGRPEAIRYDYDQDSLMKNRTRHADFDRGSGKVSVEEGGKSYRYAIVPGLVDRHAVTLAIGADLKRGAHDYDYKVAVRDRVEDMKYRRVDTESVKVPAGTFDAVLMRRVGEPGADRRRVSRSWFAESLGWIPVEIEQSGKKGDTITLKLASVKRD